MRIPDPLLISGGMPGAWSARHLTGSPEGWLVHELGRTQWFGAADRVPIPAPVHDPVADLRAALASTRRTGARSGWIGFISYELGAHFERVTEVRGTPGGWPLFALAWCPEIRSDHHGAPGPGESDRLNSDSSCSSERLWHAVSGREPLPRASGASLEIGLWRSSPGRAAYLKAVERIGQYIADGDVYQVNFARSLRAPFRGDPALLAARILSHAPAWFGAHLTLPDSKAKTHRSIVSMSPELFLYISAPDPRRGDREVVTRPIKGTSRSDEAPSVLARSVKDQAELNMIVDLMRNDLGRICRIGSIRVPHARIIETHGTVHHGAGEVRGTLAENCDLVDVLAATFPAGSITGAPKIRAMQIIDELEPEPRGPYCGAIGCIGDDGSATLSVAIRTLALTGSRTEGDEVEGELVYGTGGGIVADSVPEQEWAETEIKCAVLREAVARITPRRPEHQGAAGSLQGAAFSG